MATPKYKIGEEVWIMELNEACKCLFLCMSRSKEGEVIHAYLYVIDKLTYDGPNNRDYPMVIRVPEDKFFPTKQTLINSL